MCLWGKVIFLQSKSSTATVRYAILLLRKHCWLRIKLNYLDVKYCGSLNILDSDKNVKSLSDVAVEYECEYDRGKW